MNPYHALLVAGGYLALIAVLVGFTKSTGFRWQGKGIILVHNFILWALSLYMLVECVRQAIAGGFSGAPTTSLYPQLADGPVWQSMNGYLQNKIMIQRALFNASIRGSGRISVILRGEACKQKCENFISTSFFCTPIVVSTTSYPRASPSLSVWQRHRLDTQGSRHGAHSLHFLPVQDSRVRRHDHHGVARLLPPDLVLAHLPPLFDLPRLVGDCLLCARRRMCVYCAILALCLPSLFLLDTIILVSIYLN
jgi:hypothetical protein